MSNVWDILLDWAIERQDTSFYKSVNRSSRDKILKDEITFKDFSKFKYFILNFSNASAYSRLQCLRIQGIFKGLYDDVPRNWISLILQLNLQELELNSIEWVEESLFTKVSVPTSLTCLKISNLPITGKTIEHLLSLSPFLTSLALDNLRFVNDNLLECFPLYTPNLVHLSLEGASITSRGITALVGVWSMDYVSPHVGESKSGLKGSASKAYTRTASGLVHLETLNISECFGVDDVGLDYLAQSECELRQLKMRGLNRISSLGINLILEKNQLESLDISMVLSLKSPLLAQKRLKTLQVSSGSFPELLYVTNLSCLEISITRISDLEMLGRIILQNSSLEKLVIVKDHTLGMYSLDSWRFNPSNYPHIDIKIVSYQKGRFI